MLRNMQRAVFKPSAWGLAILLPVIFYLVVLWATGGTRPIGPPQTDYYNRLVHGMLQGHLYLDTPVDPRLFALPNPYEFTERQSIPHPHDASLYHHHYYIYFGVTPLALVMLPFRWLTGHDLPIGYVVWLFVAAEYALMIVLFRQMRARHFPGAPPAAIALCVLGLIFGGAQLTLLTRHTMYELPIASGSCFFLVTLVCLFRALESDRSRLWSAAGGLALGLAVGCRPFYVLGAVVFLLPWLFPRSRGYDWRCVAAAALACAFVGFWLAAYNAARFGSPFDFGQRYQLSGSIEGQVQHFGWRYVPYNLKVYLFAPLRWARYFPYVHTIVVPPFPRGFGGWEWSYGIVPNMPFSVFALAGLAVSWREVKLATLGFSALLWFGLLCAFFGSVGRYLGDFMPLMTLEACAGLLALLLWRDGGAWFRRLVYWFGWLTAGATAVIASLLACIMYHTVIDHSPRLFALMAHIGNAPVGWIERAAGVGEGPVELTLTLPPEIGRPEPLVASGWPPADSVWLSRPDAGHVQFYVAHDPSTPIPVGEPLALDPAAAHRIAVSTGSLYPPVEHPYFSGRPWNQIASVKRWARIALDGRWVAGTLDYFTEPNPRLVWIGRDSSDPPRAQFTGHILSVRRVAPPWADDHLPGRDLVVACRLDASRTGRTFPVVTTGRPEQGDALEIQVMAGQRFRLGYDHWGHPMVWSDSASLPADGRVSLSIHLPASDSPDPLIVRFNGRVLWLAHLDAYPVAKFEIYPGANAIGVSTCEPALPGYSSANGL